MIPNLILALAVLFLFIFVWLIYYFTNRVRSGKKPMLRSIRGFELLKSLTGRAIETGRALHLSIGVGGMADNTTADTLAGLAVLSYLAKKAAITGVSPMVSMANPMAMLYAQNAMRAAHIGDTDSADEALRNIRWIAPQPTAYAAGVMNLLALDKAEATVMVGHFGDEYLLMGEVAAQRNIAHVGGSSNPNTLPFIYLSADQTLMGEEMYAAGAYLQQRQSHIGSLMAQDTMRWLIVLAIFGGIFYHSFLKS